jgi:hypothetical protein
MYEFQKQKTKYQLLAYVSSLWKSYVPAKVPMREELRLRKTKFSQSLALFFWKTNFRTCEQHLQFRAWRVTHLFFWIQENRNTKFVIKRENRDSNQGTHNLMPHCRTMRRWMYGSGSGGDDDGVPPSPPSWDGSGRCCLRHEATPAADEAETAAAGEVGSRRRRRRWCKREEQGGAKREPTHPQSLGPTRQGHDILLLSSSKLPTPRPAAGSVSHADTPHSAPLVKVLKCLDLQILS